MRHAPRGTRWPALVLAIAVTVGCQATRAPVVGESEPEPNEIAVDARCEAADDEVLAALGEEVGDDVTLRHAQAVASEEEDVVFVAAELAEEDAAHHPIGVWAVSGAGTPPEILAVNAVARERSSWPSDERITEKTDGGEEVQACVEAAMP